MKLFRPIATLGALAVTWGYSGCWAEAASSARIADPCKLLTQAEASAALSAALGPGELKRMGIITRCAYSNAAADQKIFLDVQNETAPVTDAALFDSFTHMPDAKPVSGIGDQALWGHSEYATSLFILKGGKVVAVGLPRTVAAMTPGIEKAAKLIASRM
jgi:hypothetical protein